jgi:hypothetical protein
MVGTDEATVTYPQFLRMPTTSSCSSTEPARSARATRSSTPTNTTTKTWTRRSQVFRGTAPVSPDESAYTNHLAVSAPASCTCFYVWRITGDVADTRDVCHVKSAHNGATFTNQAGTPLTLPITPATSPIVKPGDFEIIN